MIPPSPRIVIGVGVYNEAQYLPETIPAILSQSMPDFRLWILDNGSTDGSYDILQRFAREDSRITLLRSPRNLRCPDATNLGYHACLQFWPECRWFLNAGSDDLMDRDYLEAILDTAAADPSVNCVFSPVRFIGHPEKGTWTYPAYDPRRVHEVLYVPGWRAFTRELWEKLGGEWTGIDQGSDWEWICRASVQGLLRPKQLPRSYLAVRVREGERKSQSDLGHWPTLHARMCELMYARVPQWAKNERRDRVKVGRRG